LRSDVVARNGGLIHGDIAEREIAGRGHERGSEALKFEGLNDCQTVRRIRNVRLGGRKEEMRDERKSERDKLDINEKKMGLKVPDDEKLKKWREKEDIYKKQSMR
jgi:hypothetical protein